MKIEILKKRGREAMSFLYTGRIPARKEGVVEFAEALTPPHPINEKWVLIISTALGCPVSCRICDAGTFFDGFLSKEEMLAQIDYLIANRFGGSKVPVKKFKIQFARMGEPSFNRAVLTVLEELPTRYAAPGLMPCLSTIAPTSCRDFLSALKTTKDKFYGSGKFQLQFSIHTTDTAKRDFLLPVKKLPLAEIARFGENFFRPGDRKITLNFAAIEGFPVDEKVLADCFDTDKFLIKITPLNPTASIEANGLKSLLQASAPASHSHLEERLAAKGFEVITSFGEEEENKIGTNCGQAASCLRGELSYGESPVVTPNKLEKYECVSNRK